MPSRRAFVGVSAALLLFGCGAIMGLEPLDFTERGAEAGADGPGELPDAPRVDGSGDTGIADSGSDAPIVPPFCATVDARVCTDFDDDASVGTPWRVALSEQTLVGMGVPIPPFVKSAIDHPERGPFMVTTFVPDSGGPGYHINSRQHYQPAPGWDGGLAPPRRMELKFFVNRSDPNTNSSIVSTDLGYSLSIFLTCNQDGGACLVTPSRGTAAYDLADILVPPRTWVKMIVDIPAASIVDGSAVMPPQYDVTVEVLGKAPIKKTAFFGNGNQPAPSDEVGVIGLGRPNAFEGAWEVWFDDVAVSY